MTKAVINEQRARDNAARADAILPVDLLQKKLGASTYRLWCALLTIRDEECFTHPSLPGLARIASLGEAQTEKSLARLRKFKLLEDFGFMYQKVPCRCDPTIGYHEHKVYVRRVFGCLRSQSGGSDTVALVPRSTRDLVKEAPGQGGARAGAGRPKGKLDSAPRRIIKGGVRKSNVGAYKYQEPISSVFLSEKQRNAEFHSACYSLSQKAEEKPTQKPKSLTVQPTLRRVTGSLQPKEASMRSSSVQPKAPQPRRRQRRSREARVARTARP